MWVYWPLLAGLLGAASLPLTIVCIVKWQQRVDYRQTATGYLEFRPLPHPMIYEEYAMQPLFAERIAKRWRFLDRMGYHEVAEQVRKHVFDEAEHHPYITSWAEARLRILAMEQELLRGDWNRSTYGQEITG